MMICLTSLPVREKIKLLYKFNLQPKVTTYQPYLSTLIANSQVRIENNKVYQEFIKGLKEKNELKDVEPMEDALDGVTGKVDIQLIETYNIMKDLLYLMLKSS